MGQETSSLNNEILSWLKDILIAIIIALLIRQFVFAHL